MAGIAVGQATPSPDSESYQEALELYNSGLFEDAADGFETFKTRNPRHPLVPSADYYRARSSARIDSTNREAYYEQFIRAHPNHLFTQKLLVEMAKSAEEEEDYESAIGFYERALNHKMAPQLKTEVYYWLAETEVAAGDNAAAREHFLALAEEYPNSDLAPEALYARGRLYLSDNLYDESSEAFELLKERHPNDDITRRIGTALGESYFQQGRYEEAIEAFRNEMPYLEGEYRSKAVYLIAESYNHLNELDEASQYYQQYINREEGTENERIAHYGLGWVHHKQEIYHWAYEAFEKAAVGDDEIARKALYYKAANEKLASRYDRALETFREFGEKYKEGLWVEQGYYEWAVTAFETGRNTEALDILLQLIRNDQADELEGEIYTLLGEAYFANREYTRSIQAFEEAERVSDIDPDLKIQARFQKAWVQYQNQAYQQAQREFERVYESDPDSELGNEALFWSANCHYHTGNFGPASTQFMRFINNNEDHELLGAALYSLGWSHFKMGNFAEAIGPFENFLENYEPPSIALYPYETDTRLRIGDSYYAMGDYNRAIEYYDMVVGEEPGGDYAMFQIANSHYRDDNTYEAVSTFREVLREYPESRLREQAQYNIAYIYLNSGNYSQAVEEFQTVIERYPDTEWAARSQYNIGDAYYNAGDYDEAIEAYRVVMENYPDSDYLVEAVNGIQYAQLSAGDEDSSNDILEQFLADNPQSSTADQLRFRQAENRLQSGDYDGAVEEFRQYIRITNNNNLLPEAYYNLADAYEQTDQPGEAEEAYLSIVEEYPNSDRAASALGALGRLAYDEGRYEESLDYFERLSERGQSYRLEAYIGMGNAHLAMGNLDEAGEQYEAALEADSDYDAAQVGLAKVEMDRENYEEAADRLSLVAENNTTGVGAEAQYLLGVIEQDQENYQDALDEYSTVNSLYESYDEWVAKSLLRMAECYIQIGESGEAQNRLNTIIDRYPDTEEAREAERLLDSE